MQEKLSKIRCAICSMAFEPIHSTICQSCIITQKNPGGEAEFRLAISSNDLHYCRYCQRYEGPPWTNCDRESPKLLGFLAKRIKNINSIKIVDCKFLWTEPHSKRIKIKVLYNLPIEDKTSLQETYLEQSEVLTFVEVYSQCPACRKEFTPHTWNTVIQLRQEASHPKTLLKLESSLLKHQIASSILKVESLPNGLDLFFSTLQAAQKATNLIQSICPTQAKKSKQLISQNQRDNTANVKTTICIRMAKICKGDVVISWWKKLKDLGSSGLVLCRSVGKAVKFVDLVTWKEIALSNEAYFEFEKATIIFPKQTSTMQKFIVLDCSKRQATHQKPKPKHKPKMKSKKQKHHHFAQDESFQQRTPLQRPPNSETAPSEEPEIQLGLKHHQVDTWNYVIARPDQMQQLYATADFPAECGDEILGFDVKLYDSFQFIPNAPQFLLVSRSKPGATLKKKKQRKRSSGVDQDPPVEENSSDSEFQLKDPQGEPQSTDQLQEQKTVEQDVVNEDSQFKKKNKGELETLQKSSIRSKEGIEDE